jgi:alpha-tubulin suppressor-like RCC1 family protein
MSKTVLTRLLLICILACFLPAATTAFAGFLISTVTISNTVHLTTTTVPAGRLVWYTGNRLDSITNIIQIETEPFVQHDYALPGSSSPAFFRAAIFDTNYEVTPLAIGADFALAITTNGTIESWGDNSAGQFGDGLTIIPNAFYYAGCWYLPTGFSNTSQGPVPLPGMSNWVSVAAGADHVLAIQNGGSLWAWGNNASGQLGYTNEGYGVSFASPVQVGTNASWRYVFAAGNCSFAIRSDGTLWAWGDDTDSTLGLGTNYPSTNTVWVPTQVGTSSNWVKVVCYPFSRTVGIQSDGSLWAWGSTDLPSYVRAAYAETNFSIPITTSPAPANFPGPWIGAAQNPVTGGDFLFLRADGTLWQTSTNIYELGNYQIYFGFWVSQYTNPASLYNVLINAGLSTTNAYTYVDDALFIPEYPYLANFNPSNFQAVVQLFNDTNFLESASSRSGWTMLDAQIALNQDGTVWTIGDNPTRWPSSPQDGPWQRLDTETNWQYVCGTYQGLKGAVKSDGSIWLWNMAYGLYLNGPLLSLPVLVPTNKWISAKVSATHVVALDTESNLWVWGGNTAGQLGMGDYEPRLSPAPLPMAGPWLSFSVNDYQTLAVHQGGQLWAWGNFDNTGTNASSPVRLNPERAWAAVYAPDEISSTNFYALAQDTTLWQYGAPVPQQVSGSNWAFVSPSLQCALAVKTDGSLWAWGTNFGFGLTNFYALTNPAAVSGSSWLNVSVGYTPEGLSHGDYDTTNYPADTGSGADGFAIRSDGTLWAWGVNDINCQLGLVSNLAWADTNCWNCYTEPCGNPSPIVQAYGTNVIVSPQQVGTENDWKAVCYAGNMTLSSFEYTVGLKQDGSMWVWGYSPFTNVVSQDLLLTPPSNPYPGIPYPQSVNLLTYPYRLGTNTWSYVDKSAGVTTSGELYVWGRTQASPTSSQAGPVLSMHGYYWRDENADGQMLVPPTWEPQLVPSNVVCRLPPRVP